VTIVALMLPMPARAGTVLLSVHDGEFFYDSTNDGVCNPDTNTPTGAVAVRHWHVGVPFVGASSEVAGGFGCLGGGTNWQPQSWTVTVTGTAQVAGTITYTWDTNVPGGCCNDVHLQVMDSQGGLVQSTVLTDGLKPVIPVVMQVRSHSFDFTLPAGTYTIYEDIFSGEHTAWLSNFTIVDSV
jgi:hypothetical protein